MFCYNLKSFFKSILFSSAAILFSPLSFAQTPLFSPAMSITELGSVSSPANETVVNIIDGSTATKFLDFNFSDGMGFTVDLGENLKVATSISITTANDSPNRDPQIYTVSGSIDGANFTEITSGVITCNNTRFYERTYNFNNTSSYKYYRINFDTQCGTDNSIQLSEVQLYSLSPVFNHDLIQTGYNEIMGVVFNTDGTKMFVWEKSGKVYVSNWDGNSYIKQATPVLDISDEVGNWRDFGFSSFCLDPDFETNGKVYMFYMVDREHLLNFGTPQYDPNNNQYYNASISRVTRYTLNIDSNPLTTDYNSRKVLLGESISTGVPLTHESHAGGTILFGNDGTLLVSTGDNASYASTDVGSASETYYQQAINDGILRPEENVGAFRSQMITSFCGKILRLDPDTGDGIPSNPHFDVSNPRSPKSRMWAMGLRNPFRMSIQPGSGSSNPNDGDPGVLQVADVGWNTWEDLHIFNKGGLNGGWPLYEGQTQLNSYYNSGTTNPDEGNVLFKNNCIQPSSFVDNSDAAMRRFVHDRPELAYKHGSNDTRVPWFSGTTPTDPRVGTSGSPTTGIQFNGNAVIAGTYIIGDALGSSMSGTYLFTDYVRNFINIATLTNGSQNWISDVAELAPINTGAGIVHMMQNPLDGFVYYVNIFNGELRRISFVAPSWINEPTNITVECDSTSDPGGVFATWLNSFSGTVSCGNGTVTNNSTGLSDLCGSTGSEIVTFTLSDECGNSITKNATFTIVDNTDPTWLAEPADYTFSCDGITDPIDAFNTWLISFSGEDACGTAVVSNNSSGLTYDCNSVGTETVIFTLTDECGNNISKQGLFTVENTLAIEKDPIEELKIYPNPTENSLTISGLKTDGVIYVFDVLGKRVKNLSVKNNVPFNLELPSSIYIVKIDQGDLLTIKKLIVN
jgi:glucose/arabinose dehydrogenase